MKKLLLSALLVASTAMVNAAILPEPSVRPLPSNVGYFDAFVVSWAENPTQPYSLELVDPSGVTVTKNLVEDLECVVGLTEYQEDEDTPNYPDSRLVVTLYMFETDANATYTLTVPAGTVNVLVGDEKVPNAKVTYSFTLTASEDNRTLPEPNIEPAPGEVEALNVVKMSWMGVLGSLDLLNELNYVDEEANIAPVTLTCNGVELDNPVISFDWSSRQAVTDGAAGDILVITLTEEDSLPAGEYIINIPENYLQISDIETGTLYSDEIVLSYVVTADSTGILSIKKANNNNVYDMNGVNLGNTSLDKLPKGVYIMNGKKVRN